MTPEELIALCDAADRLDTGFVGRLNDCGFIATPDGIARARRHAALWAALEEEVCDCDEPDCVEVAVWEWRDNDGYEMKCDSHKGRHYYADGPVLIESRMRSREALATTGGTK